MAGEKEREEQDAKRKREEAQRQQEEARKKQQQEAKDVSGSTSKSGMATSDQQNRPVKAGAGPESQGLGLVQQNQGGAVKRPAGAGRKVDKADEVDDDPNGVAGNTKIRLKLDLVLDVRVIAALKGDVAVGLM